MSTASVPDADAASTARPAAPVVTGGGAGPGSKARRLAGLAEFTARQIDQARELIEDGGVIPTAMAAVVRTVSSDGLRVYLTTLNACTCPAAKACFHRAALLMVAG
jgi:hypothetical protein